MKAQYELNSKGLVASESVDNTTSFKQTSIIRKLNNPERFDVFISYQWDIKENVKMLYNQLTKSHGLRCWMDDFEMGSGSLNESKFLLFEC